MQTTERQFDTCVYDLTNEASLALPTQIHHQTGISQNQTKYNIAFNLKNK